MGLIHLLLRQSSLLLQRDPAVVQLLGGVKCALGGLHVRSGLGLVFDHGRAGHGRVGSLRLFVLILAFFQRRREIAAFQFGDQLPGANMIPAIDQHALHGSADLGRHVGLIDGKQNRVGGHDVIDRAKHGGFDQHRRRRFRLRRLFVGFAASGEQRRGHDQARERYFVFVGHVARTSP